MTSGGAVSIGQTVIWDSVDGQGWSRMVKGRMGIRSHALCTMYGILYTTYGIYGILYTTYNVLDYMYGILYKQDLIRHTVNGILCTTYGVRHNVHGM